MMAKAPTKVGVFHDVANGHHQECSVEHRGKPSALAKVCGLQPTGKRQLRSQVVL